ncbi:Uncharacterised protein [Vibrio cholerae]|nr:Uncharacterised protein [Vibrio cholerae]
MSIGFFGSLHMAWLRFGSDRLILNYFPVFDNGHSKGTYPIVITVLTSILYQPHPRSARF